MKEAAILRIRNILVPNCCNVCLTLSMRDYVLTSAGYWVSKLMLENFGETIFFFLRSNTYIKIFGNPEGYTWVWQNQ